MHNWSRINRRSEDVMVVDISAEIIRKLRKEELNEIALY
jgi:hypothetical protein